ncbi:MAG: glutamyl-tRNA reductase [Pirellulales bacterium]
MSTPILQMVGCSHHRSAVSVRERLAFDRGQVAAALKAWQQQYPDSEAVLISTCNRVEFYTASGGSTGAPSYQAVAEFLADFHAVPLDVVTSALVEQSDRHAVRHLFSVAASLDSMVLGEPQILAQVKEAYRVAQDEQSVGPITHHAFQAALRVARRVAAETSIHHRRVSIPSVAVADFAGRIFERLNDKRVLVLGAGAMAEETIRYLQEGGAGQITVVNRSEQRGRDLAERWHGTFRPWDERYPACTDADLVVSTTGGSEPIITLDDFRQRVEPGRYQRPLMILDLAMPRDFEPGIGDCVGVYLYSIDDLSDVCEKNRQRRAEDLPAARKIVDDETQTFMADVYHRATAPIIAQLRDGWQNPKQQELQRLLQRLPDLDEKSKKEISQSFDRLVNKLLHPPLQSLRDESQHGTPLGLLDALKRLFQLHD